MANVKVFADKQMNRPTGQNLYAPDLSMLGHKNHEMFANVSWTNQDSPQ